MLEKVDFPQQVLVVEASYGVASRADKFLVLLNKIVKPEDQEKAVEKGIERLVRGNKKTSPLLNALKGRTFRSERVEQLAIQKAFMEGVKSKRGYRLPDDICNHAAITPEVYAKALIVVADRRICDDMREFLLENADRSDLRAVKEKAVYADLNFEFRDAIERALKRAMLRGTRVGDIERAKIAKKTLDEITSVRVPPEIADVVGSYLVEKFTSKKKVKIVKKIVGLATCIPLKTRMRQFVSSCKCRKRKRSKSTE